MCRSSAMSHHDPTHVPHHRCSPASPPAPHWAGGEGGAGHLAALGCERSGTFLIGGEQHPARGEQGANAQQRTRDCSKEGKARTTSVDKGRSGRQAEAKASLNGPGWSQPYSGITAAFLASFQGPRRLKDRKPGPRLVPAVVRYPIVPVPVVRIRPPVGNSRCHHAIHLFTAAACRNASPGKPSAYQFAYSAL
ncbi:hypothetical protein BKA56DRAFT_613254 [Ilyonectria sp. MPI-CAGE-AT-0026]|nr:hypothetical protein BKA56DRAFT_613254 [Ilyonectria sp. MPI-CAGE-AT-0026]